uniref:Uncharacterized protein n=1 Tax=Ditylenchus dipsaci TaxID=166011 RepID=A0A915E2E8_9BILA
MPSSTATMASNNNSAANAEKFLLQQQLKRLNQQQNGVNYQINNPDKSATNLDRWSGGKLLVIPPDIGAAIQQKCKKTGADSHKPHHHHHHRQHSHQKRSQKSTEFPVLVNGQLPESSATARDADLSGFPSSNSSQLRTQSAKKESVVVSMCETNGHKTSGHKLSSASKLLEAAKKTSVQKQELECLPYNTLVNDDVAAACSSSATNGQIVAVRMSAENQRHFDLGVTGGSDLSHPAIVSRITATNGSQTQPVTFIPLNEGDQLLKINGRDELKSTGSDILLHIKPNVYRCCSVLVDDEDTNSQTSHKKSSGSALGSAVDVQHHQQQHVADSVPRSDKLAQSLVLLKEAIENGQVVKQFEQLYRKKPGMSMDDSKLPENAGKNRYRDVCPYDSTRVLLKDSPTGNYINACHVNMEIPCSGIVNRNHYCYADHFGGKGRVKCHQYWPDQPKETMDLGSGSPLQVTNMSEKVEAHCHYRELAIRHKITREERLVTQMQYTAWPDHGVPENPQHFIEFVNEVRKARNGSLDPLIVHCSAGIGRTGVLILMETSACQIEANEPVYPLDSMRLMRDQRAMLIQQRAYNEQSVRPLAEYQKCR